MNRISRIGLDNLDRLARLDAEVRDRITEGDMQESEAKANALGNMTGTLTGIGGTIAAEYADKKSGAEIIGQQSAQKPAASAVSPNRVMGDNSLLAERDSRNVNQKMDDYTGQGLGSVAIRGSIDQAQPDILKDRSIVAMRSPGRSYLSSLYGDTSDDFKVAFNNVLSSFPSQFIGS